MNDLGFGYSQKQKETGGTGHYPALAEFLHTTFLFLALLLCHISYRQVHNVVPMLHNTSPVVDLIIPPRKTHADYFSL